MRAFCHRIRRRWLAIALLGWIVILVLPAPLSRAAEPSVTPLGAYAGPLGAPARVVADAAGNVYVTDPAAGRVSVFDAFGRPRSVRTGLAGPLAIAVDEGGQIYVGEQGKGSVTVFDGQWRPLYQLGGGEREFLLPNYVAVDPTSGGRVVYVSDSLAHRVNLYTNGAWALSFGGQGALPGQFDFPAGILVSHGGEVFVVDQKNERVQIFDRSGRYQREFTLVTRSGGMGTGSTGGRSQGITSDSEGRLYVVDTFQCWVRVFDAQGAFLGRMGTLGEGRGQLRSPSGLCLDPFQRLLVASANNGRLEVFGLGSFLHFASAPSSPILGVGTNVTLSVLAGGAGPFTFQWRKGTNDLTDGERIHGAGNAILNLVGVLPEDSGDYTVVVRGPSGTVASPSAALKVLAAPRLILEPASQVVVQGATVSFGVEAEGEGLTYQWQFNGMNLEGANGPLLVLANVAPWDAGEYSVAVANPAGAVTSSAAVLTVQNPLVPPHLQVVALLPATGLAFVLRGAPGDVCFLEGSSNLADWTTLTNLVLETDTVQVTLGEDLGQPQRFYRLRRVP